jgi:hypothetical protein
VVARARRDDAARTLGVRQSRDTHVGAANLERTRALQVLALQQDVATDELGEPSRRLDWRAASDPFEQRRRSAGIGNPLLRIAGHGHARSLAPMG